MSRLLSQLARYSIMSKKMARKMKSIGMQVLEGYVYLGNVNSLGEEVMAAFAEVMGAAALKVTALASCGIAHHHGLHVTQIAALTLAVCGKSCKLVTNESQ